MREENDYRGLDYFRLAAAFLVIAIHTSPLASFNLTDDYFLTRVLGRVAVPFFFMVTGFFLFSNCSASGQKERERVHRFIHKTCIYYMASMILYLPILLYNGYFKSSEFTNHVWNDIIFNGTFYHLWYLPAAILGVWIVSILLQHFNRKATFGITLFLYLIGLMGDSYYHGAINIPGIKSMFDFLFTFFGYTRNGLFFAPVFLMLGAVSSVYTIKNVKRSAIPGFFISFLLLMLEAFQLRKLGWQRHDSMYILLLPVMWYLFQLLKSVKGRRNKTISDMAFLIYLIHPLMIIFLRGFAKATNLENILIYNSLIHFLIVSLVSLGFAHLFAVLWNNHKTKKSVNKGTKKDRAWLEVNLQHMKMNVENIQNILPSGCTYMAVVKANAYGHGSVKVANFLNEIGINTFAVATIEEAIQLRCNGVNGEILILGYTDPKRRCDLSTYDLTQTIVNYDHAKKLAQGMQPVKVHIKVDTGMHRLGEEYCNLDTIEQIFKESKLKVCGIFTHLCTSDRIDGADVDFTLGQVKKFNQLLMTLQAKGIILPRIHIQSTYGILNYPELKCDYARIGIAMYGALSSKNAWTRQSISLHPVMELKVRVALIRTISAGETVSYARTFCAKRDTRIAVLPIGYADGIPSTLSGGKGSVLIRGLRVPIIGRICMDQMIVDVTDLPFVKENDIATLIGLDGKERITAEEMAEAAGIITNELFSRLGNRLERFYLNE